MSAPTAADITEFLGRWWFLYDAGDIDALGSLLTDGASFRTRTDSGATDYEEFVRSDVTGREAILTWQRAHRAESPHPLRHMTLNVAVDGSSGAGTCFTSYLFVTQILAGKPDPISTGVLQGTVQRTAFGLRFSDFELTLDTQESVALKDR